MTPPRRRSERGVPAFPRRDLLKLGGVTLVAAVFGQPPRGRPVAAQTARQGGTLTIRAWDPPHFDPMLTTSFKTYIPYTFTHSRLLKHRAGPSVRPGTFPIEGDLAESWTQPNETTYVFKLRKGVRWHPKPPVNGRELTAEDVRYSVERFRTVRGNANASRLAPVAKVEALDRHTVRFTLKAPFAWFPDMIASPMALPIIARECVRKFGDLKKPEAVVGTGPWMLERYDPGARLVMVRNPHYFVPGLPSIDRVELVVDEDPAARLAAFAQGKYDLGVEFPGSIDRADWEPVRKKRPNLRSLEFPSNIMSHISMRTDRPPFTDARVRRAMSLAINRQRMIEATYEGAGVLNPPVPAALREWSIPIDQLGESGRYYAYDPAEARRLLAQAGHASGFSTTLDFTTYGSTVLVDQMQQILKDLKNVGIEVRLNQKEYEAYFATTFYGKYEGIAYGPQTPFLEPDSFLYGQYYPGQPKNQSRVNDPALSGMLARQRRIPDVVRRRELIYEIQRYLASQQYYLQMPASLYVAVWDPALKNFGPNLGYDYGGRLTAAWLDR